MLSFWQMNMIEHWQIFYEGEMIWGWNQGSRKRSDEMAWKLFHPLGWGPLA